MIFRGFGRQLQRIRGDGFAREVDVFNSRNEAGRDRKLYLADF